MKPNKLALWDSMVENQKVEKLADMLAAVKTSLNQIQQAMGLGEKTDSPPAQADDQQGTKSETPATTVKKIRLKCGDSVPLRVPATANVPPAGVPQVRQTTAPPTATGILKHLPASTDCADTNTSVTLDVGICQNKNCIGCAGFASFVGTTPRKFYVGPGKGNKMGGVSRAVRERRARANQISRPDNLVLNHNIARALATIMPLNQATLTTLVRDGTLLKIVQATEVGKTLLPLVSIYGDPITNVDICTDCWLDKGLWNENMYIQDRNWYMVLTLFYLVAYAVLGNHKGGGTATEQGCRGETKAESADGGGADTITDRIIKILDARLAKVPAPFNTPWLHTKRVYMDVQGTTVLLENTEKIPAYLYDANWLLPLLLCKVSPAFYQHYQGYLSCLDKALLLVTNYHTEHNVQIQLGNLPLFRPRAQCTTPIHDRWAKTLMLTLGITTMRMLNEKVWCPIATATIYTHAPIWHRHKLLGMLGDKDEKIVRMITGYLSATDRFSAIMIYNLMRYTDPNPEWWEKIKVVELDA